MAEEKIPGRPNGFCGGSGASQPQLIRPAQTHERKKGANRKRGKREKVTQRGLVP
jgi:hypothetical protein